ncbi:MAG: hypothetical protein HOV87_27215 [Catenulispora sp.]|nr:hypothetical protein [Catenulispora sp.]
MMSKKNSDHWFTGPGMSRRRLIMAGAAGVGAVGAVGAGSLGGAAWASDAADGAGSGAGRGPGLAGLADTVFAALKRHRLVAIGEVHGLQEHYDALASVLTDPRLPGLVDDVVFEGGNSLYQAVADRFVSGLPVARSELRPLWRNSTNSPLATGDEPIYEDLFRVVRAVNWRLPAQRQVRLLLGDAPIDWPKITTADQVLALRNERDAFAASLVRREVLDKERKALICYGAAHVTHHAGTTRPPGTPSGVVSLIEEQTGQRVFSLVTLVPLAGDPGGLAARLSPYPRGVVIPTTGTWLGAFDAGDVFPAFAPGASGQPVNTNCGVPLGKLTDGGLYLGRAEDLTMSRPDPAIYLDPAYWAELQRRNDLQGGVVDLDVLRTEQSVHFMPQPVPPPLLCS